MYISTLWQICFLFPDHVPSIIFGRENDGIYMQNKPQQRIEAVWLQDWSNTFAADKSEKLLQAKQAYVVSEVYIWIYLPSMQHLIMHTRLIPMNGHNSHACHF